jgi:hypothetical protein
MSNRRARYFAYVSADSKEIEAGRPEQRIAVLVSSTGIKYKGGCHKRLYYMAVQNPSMHFSVTIVGALIGVVILFFGRKLFWLCVAAVGFAAGVELAPHLVHEPSPLLALTVALVLGLIGALLALFLQKIAIAVLGFLAGGKLAGAIAAAFFIHYAQYSTFIFLAGGIIGAILLLVLFDWALIVVSSLIGAHLIQGAIVLPPSGSTIVFIALTIIGVLAQAAFLRRSQA